MNDKTTVSPRSRRRCTHFASSVDLPTPPAPPLHQAPIRGGVRPGVERVEVVRAFDEPLGRRVHEFLVQRNLTLEICLVGCLDMVRETRSDGGLQILADDLAQRPAVAAKVPRRPFVRSALCASALASSPASSATSRPLTLTPASSNHLRRHSFWLSSMVAPHCRGMAISGVFWSGSQLAS